MGRNFIFGDYHNGKEELFYLENSRFPEQKELTKEDVIFFLGDFGCFWYYPEYLDGYNNDIKALDFILNKNYTSFIILGNHENYDLIEKLPIIEKFGGRVYVYTNDNNKSLYIAIRGEIYIVNNKKIFTFNGAKSSDKGRYSLALHKSGEIIKKPKYRYGELIGYKRESIKLSQVNIWNQELPTKEEMFYALSNLKKHKYKVDYIFTHTCSQIIINQMINNTLKRKMYDPVSIFLDEIYNLTEFTEWHYGHFHLNIKYKNIYCHYKAIPLEIF